MSGIEAIEKDIEWIKNTLVRIEERLSRQQDACLETHKAVDTRMESLNVKIILIACAVGGGAAGAVEILKAILGG